MASRYVVRYGTMRHLGEFGVRELPRDVRVSRGSQVIVRSHRGTEFGEVLCPATDRTRELLGRSDSTGSILRIASHVDDTLRSETAKKAQDVFLRAVEVVREHGLQMQLVDVEWLFGGEKAIFYYTSEDRVDFRELVRSLAKRFKTRIEMRQIGIRDEAKLLADYGDCGKPVCCNTHLTKMPRVSMKMAKVQKASLDPTKISGRCGRLKCCLRYEYDTYVEHQKDLPKAGKWIETESGIGKVLAQEILARKVLVNFEDGRRIVVAAEEILSIVPAPDRANPKDGRDSARGRTNPESKSTSATNKTPRSGKTTAVSPEQAPDEASKAGPNGGGRKRTRSRQRKRGEKKQDTAKQGTTEVTPSADRHSTRETEPSSGTESNRDKTGRDTEGKSRKPRRRRSRRRKPDGNGPENQRSDSSGPDGS